MLRLTKTLSAAAAAVASQPKQETLSFALREQTSQSGTRPPEPRPVLAPSTPVGTTVPPAEALFSVVREILGGELAEPRSEAEVAKLLAVSKPQAKAWLAELVAEGVLEKLAKPVRYRAITTAGRLL